MAKGAGASSLPTPLTSAVIIRSLMAEAGARRRETLRRLVEACDQISATQEIKFVDIEQYIRDSCGSDVGPRAQSISNEKKLPLGMYHYVEARNRERQRSGRSSLLKGRMVFGRTLIDRVEKIADMDLRSEMRDVVDRLETTERAFARAKALFKMLNMDFDELALDNTTARQLVDGDYKVEPEAINALHQLLAILTDDGLLSRCGLALREGRIARRAGTMDELIPAEVMTGVLSLQKSLRIRSSTQLS